MPRARKDSRPWEADSESDAFVDPGPVRRSDRNRTSGRRRVVYNFDYNDDHNDDHNNDYNDGVAGSTRAATRRRPVVHDSQPAMTRRNSFDEHAELLCSRSSSLNREEGDSGLTNFEDAAEIDAHKRPPDSSSTEVECTPSKNERSSSIVAHDTHSLASGAFDNDLSVHVVQASATASVVRETLPVTNQRSWVSQEATPSASSDPSIIEDTFTLRSAPFKRPRLASSTRVKITVCFWRGEADKLFDVFEQKRYPTYGSGTPQARSRLPPAEMFIHLAASPCPGFEQISSSSKIEDTFFSTHFPGSTSVLDVKHQIRRLLNVHFDHTTPEHLDPQFHFYDEIAPKTRRCRQTEPALTDQLSSLLVQHSEARSSVAEQLLLIIHQIKRTHKRPFCSRKSWTSLPPCVWTISTRRSEQLLSPFRSFPEYLFATQHERVIQDHITTELLPRHVGDDYPHCAEPEDSRLAVLFGPGLTTEPSR